MVKYLHNRLFKNIILKKLKKNRQHKKPVTPALRKPDFILAYALLFLPVVILLISTITIGIGRKLENHRQAVIQNSFNQELQLVLQKTKRVVSDGTIDQYIISNDQAGALTALQKIGKKYQMTALVAVNKDGVAIARLASPRNGDYVTLTTPWGRNMIQGQSAVMVGEGRNYPLMINADVPIIRNGQIIGGLIGSEILNDTYALNFQKKYLHSGEQIVFYSEKIGLYGNSFTDSETKENVKNYFNGGTSWVKNNINNSISSRFNINGKVYHLRNIPLKDIDGNQVGGIIIFFPVKAQLSYLTGIVAGLLILLWLIIHALRKHKKNKPLLFGLLIIIVIFALANFYIYRWALNLFNYPINTPPFAIYNSTITVSPDSDILEKTKEQRLAIKITAGGEDINAAEASIEYDPSLIQVEDILMENSFCLPSFVLEKEIDNEKGLVNIVCGRPNGFAEDTAVLAELLIQPIATGKLTLHFGPTTKVLANDGLGTNVLRTITDGTYQIIERKPKEDEIIIFSDTHPNEARWYNKNKISVNWSTTELPILYAYALDQKTNTIPDKSQTTSANNLSLKVKKDGIYYFHLRPLDAENNSSVFHLKIMVDTAPPDIPSIKVSATEVKLGEIVRFIFSTNKDNLSGLQKNYYVKLGKNDTFYPTLPQLFTSFQEKGQQVITLRVFDNAGNYRDASININVK